ncbi:MAG: ISL3 family transposase, partial [Verrucomicrobiaceae bacterium]
SNGKLEGINNKIGAMQRMHYGLRDFEFLSLRILTLHKAKHTFCG